MLTTFVFIAAFVAGCTIAYVVNAFFGMLCNNILLVVFVATVAGIYLEVVAGMACVAGSIVIIVYPQC